MTRSTPVLFFFYAYRSLRARIKANAITMLSVGLFVAGGSLGLSFYLGLKQMLVNTAPAENIIVMSKGATSYSDSKLDMETVGKIAVLDGIKTVGDARQVVRELVSFAQLDPPKPGQFVPAVPIRGIDELSLKVHHATLVSGSAPAPDSLEVMLGRRVAEQYPNLQVGHDIRLPGGTARIAGIFAAGGGPFEDEVWTRRAALELHVKLKMTSMTLVAADATHVPTIVAKINSTKELKAWAAPLATFREQGAGLRTIAFTILILLVLLSVVAASAISTTMNAAVVIRMPELAAMAAIGVRKSSLGNIILMESALLGVVGAVVGALASGLIGNQLGSFSLGAASARLSPSPEVVLIGLGLGLFVGLIGGLLPAIRVRRLDIMQALR